MVIDGTSKAMDNGVQAEITDGRMFVPFRALGEALGVSVEWDGDTKQQYIINNSQLIYYKLAYVFILKKYLEIL